MLKKPMTTPQKIALGYFVILAFVAGLNYIPGFKDDQGLICGVFELDIADDLLHLGSALWAFLGAILSRRAAVFYLIAFGAIYLGDGLLGLATGSGYLDLGIWRWGVQDLSFGFKIAANTPHIVLGGVAFLSGLKFRRA
ncbi:hypothetical protein QKW60_14755 [Defluviimonas aestuarii]|uniref:hypothetical protein n=1 Tax=Albidovulum aestuarii TaxID=1130726 RepID=UPI00249BA330|nr:hypothetical protein [Defluviimonas aestuarii]MDI3337675.1 hypothetical protein [Defluviimonas aestuarii]